MAAGTVDECPCFEAEGLKDYEGFKPSSESQEDSRRISEVEVWISKLKTSCKNEDLLESTSFYVAIIISRKAVLVSTLYQTEFIPHPDGGRVSKVEIMAVGQERAGHTRAARGDDAITVRNARAAAVSPSITTTNDHDYPLLTCCQQAANIECSFVLQKIALGYMFHAFMVIPTRRFAGAIMHMIEKLPDGQPQHSGCSVSVQDNDLALAAVLVCTSLYGFQIYVAVQALIQFHKYGQRKHQNSRQYAYIVALISSLSTCFCILIAKDPYAPALGWRDDYYGLEVIVQDGKLSAVAVGCRAALGLAGNAFMVWRAITIWDDRRCLQWFLRLVYTFYFGVCVVAVFLHISSLEDFIVLMGDLRYYWFLPKDRLSHVIHVKAMYQTWWMVELGGSVGVSALATVLISGRLLLERRRSGHLRKMLVRFKSNLTREDVGTTAIALESGLPAILIGLSAVVSRGSHGPQKSPGSADYPPKLTYIDYMLHSIWIAGLALGCQVILYRILSGRAWTSRPTYTRRHFRDSPSRSPFRSNLQPFGPVFDCRAFWSLREGQIADTIIRISHSNHNASLLYMFNQLRGRPPKQAFTDRVLLFSYAFGCYVSVDRFRLNLMIPAMLPSGLKADKVSRLDHYEEVNPSGAPIFLKPKPELSVAPNASKHLATQIDVEYWSIILHFFLLTIRFILFLRERRPHLIDAPGLWLPADYVGPGPVRETAASFGCTVAISLIGDAFLVWLAAILWSHNRLMKWVPVVLYIIYFGAAIASTVFKVYTFRDVDLAAAKFVEWFAEADRPAEYQEGYDHFQALRLAQFAYQSWRITDFAMSVGSGIFKSALPYRRLIALLLESALPFTLVGVAGAISTAFIDPFGQKQNKATTIFPLMIVLWTNPLALGPQLIIFRILSRKTWTSNPTTSPSRVISQPILFAQATSRRSHDALSTHSSDMDEEEVMARVGSGKMLACPMDHPVRRRSENRMSV
ncbi:hypothetical protein BKA70DRAFT_1405165 [Coprinopsis sp. MPI-PUGE-AT-0042]|nr:hypothetical protein BKA70DRAFT_1405165 [Coprinopsis sp. MPI-PUGE-AT-0042]